MQTPAGGILVRASGGLVILGALGLVLAPAAPWGTGAWWFNLSGLLVLQGLIFIPIGAALRTPDPDASQPHDGVCLRCGYRLAGRRGCTECGWGQDDSGVTD